mmetsp:Transcript_58840/g.156641  ORF Transcript_58840/g.156641 Transcript_58840/m.156641 type:complete len:238 (-) Transcript_58840:546-1259(-)
MAICSKAARVCILSRESISAHVLCSMLKLLRMSSSVCMRHIWARTLAVNSTGKLPLTNVDATHAALSSFLMATVLIYSTTPVLTSSRVLAESTLPPIAESTLDWPCSVRDVTPGMRSLRANAVNSSLFHTPSPSESNSAMISAVSFPSSREILKMEATASKSVFEMLPSFDTSNKSNAPSTRTSEFLLSPWMKFMASEKMSSALSIESTNMSFELFFEELKLSVNSRVQFAAFANTL